MTLPATPEEFLGYMVEAAASLPGEVPGGHWQQHADNLAIFLAQQAGRFPVQGALALIGIGGALVTMANREREARRKARPSGQAGDEA